MEVLGTPFVIQSDGRWKDFLAQLWAPFVVPSGNEGCTDARIFDSGPGWCVHFSQGWGVEDDDPWALVNELRNVLFQAALESSAHRVAALHAAVVEHHGRGLLLAGTSGSGKTTLTLELVDRGWSYHSDDLAPIHIDSGVVASFPKPLHVKNLVQWQFYRERWVPPAWVPAPRNSFLVPAVALGPTGGEAVFPRHLVFPRYAPGRRARLLPLSPARAVARGVPNLQSSRRMSSSGLGAVRRLCEQSRAAELVCATAAEGADLIEGWVESLDKRDYYVADERNVKWWHR